MTKLTIDQRHYVGKIRKAADAYGMDGLRMLVLSAYTKEQLEEAYAKDFYLNEMTCGDTFAIRQWDNLAELMGHDERMTVARLAANMPDSVATRVGMLKHTARTIAANDLYYEQESVEPIEPSDFLEMYLNQLTREEFLDKPLVKCYEAYKEFCRNEDYKPRERSKFREQVKKHFNLGVGLKSGYSQFMEPEEAEAIKAERKAKKLARRGAK